MLMTKKELIEGYKGIPTANICDAMDQLGLPLGVISELLPISATQKQAVGFAVTLKQMERHQAAEGKSLATHSQVVDDEISYGDILVIDNNGRRDVCTGGALLARRAKMRGASGYVINGCLRDIREIVELDFPVHLVGANPVKSVPHLQTVGVNIPVEIHGVQINPGDLIITDDTGIVVVPIIYAEKVLEKAKEIHAKEIQLDKLVASGMSFAEAAVKAKFQRE